MEKKDDERGYNGWTNYETWAVALWLDNDQSSYLYWREQVTFHRRNAEDDSSVRRGIMTGGEAIRCNLASQLKVEVAEASPLQGWANLYVDLLAAALGAVNWLEIVDHWLSEA